jgi:hypothetical protein
VVDIAMFLVTDKGEVWRASTVGGSVTRLASDPGCEARKIAVTNAWIYWTCGNAIGGSVKKTPRPL